MEADPRVWIAALRRGHDRLAAFVAGTHESELARQSMCADWDVAHVLSHLGSGAEIAMATVTGTPIENTEVWARWNGLDRAAMASGYVSADERLVAWYEGLSDDELATTQIKLAFLPGPVDVTTAVGFRLSEATLHGWDVLASFDPDAALAADATPLLVDRLPMMVGFLGRFTPRETRPAQDTTIAVTTSEPERHYELELGDNADLRPASGGATAGQLTLPAEALLRLTAGRLASDREAGARITGALSLDDLRKAFPGY